MNSNKTYKFVINGTSVPCIKADSDEEHVIKCLSELSEDKTIDIDRISKIFYKPSNPTPSSSSTTHVKHLGKFSEKQVIETLRMCDKIMAKGEFKYTPVADIVRQLPYDYVDTVAITESPKWKIADIWRDHNVKHHTIWGYRQLTLLDFGYDAEGSLSSIQTVTNDGSLVSISGYQDLHEDFLQNYNLIEENNNA